ncbi:MAG: hypothetical protein IPK95_06970 [Cellvibrionales bacterium]|nr:hypothetical protein [Cellvibrionales bacterium]
MARERKNGLAGGWNRNIATQLVDVALTRQKCRLIANALGTPPADIIKRIRDEATVWSAHCAAKSSRLYNFKAGLDFIITQGGEGVADHTRATWVPGAVFFSSMTVGDTPVLAAGGIGNSRRVLAAMAMVRKAYGLKAIVVDS